MLLDSAATIIIEFIIISDENTYLQIWYLNQKNHHRDQISLHNRRSIQNRFQSKYSGKEETETKSTVKLEKGEARIHETLSLKTHLNFDPITNKYLEKKAILTIYVISNSGRNAAGLLHIDLGKLLNDPADNKI